MFHDLSVQLLDECYSVNQDTTYHLIANNMEGWNNESCFRIMNLLDLKVNPENSQLITHSSFQDVLSSFWNGDLDIENAQFKSFVTKPWLVRIFLFLLYMSKKLQLSLIIFTKNVD